jgi:FkbM family methyltransferase
MKIKTSVSSHFKSVARRIFYGAGPVRETPWQQRYAGYAPEDLWVFDKFRNISREAEPGFLKDYLGVRIRPESLPEFCRHLAGMIQDLPVPEDWNAEAIEHIGLLKSVHDAMGSYRVMELGAGWGDWLVAGAVAAVHLGIKDIHMFGVEADAGHYASMRQHLIDNGFNPDKHSLLHAAVGATSGKAFFPRVKDFSNQWAARPMQEGNASDLAYLTTLMGGNLPEMEEVEVIALKDLLVKENRWDLVHMDVQGLEMAICNAGIDELNKRVSRVVIGTHSRKLDGDLVDLFHRAGWVLEHEKPTQFTYNRTLAQLENMTRVDGTQVWRNPRVWEKGKRPFLLD